MTSNLACLMALCRMICSSWGGQPVPHHAVLQHDQPPGLHHGLVPGDLQQLGDQHVPYLAAYNMTSHLACIMAFCRVICSSQGAGMFLPRLSFNKTWLHHGRVQRDLQQLGLGGQHLPHHAVLLHTPPPGHHHGRLQGDLQPLVGQRVPHQAALQHVKRRSPAGRTS